MRDQSDAAVSALIGRRLLQGAVTLLMATLLIHAAVILIPGDPIRAIWGQSRPPPAAVADIRDRYHLDDPYPLQYVKWLADLARGDLGISYPFAAVGSAVVAEGVPVAGTIAAAAPVSARLLGVAAAAQLLLGVVAGLGAVMAARSPSLRARVMRVPATGRHHDALGAVRRHVDGIMYGGAVIAAAAPAILVAYPGQIVFGHRLQWLPVQGLHQGWVSYVLPIVAMALASIGYVALVTRRALMDVLHELFVTAAVARGMSDRRVIVVHALRPALPSILALAAANLGVLVASQIIVEGVFALPGVGNLIFEAIRRHDMPLLVPSVTLVIALVIVANLAADVAAAAADPRMRGLD